MNDMFSVFYLVGGSTNFICKSLFGKYSFVDAQKEVDQLKNSGYKSMCVKDGSFGYHSYTDFETETLAKEYYNSLK